MSDRTVLLAVVVGVGIYAASAAFGFRSRWPGVVVGVLVFLVLAAL